MSASNSLSSARTLDRSFIEALSNELRDKPAPQRAEVLKALVERIRTKDLDCPYIGPFKILLDLAKDSGLGIPDETELAQEVELAAIQRIFGQEPRMRSFFAFTDLSWEERKIGLVSLVPVIRLPNFIHIGDPQVLDFLQKYREALNWPVVIDIGGTEVFARTELTKEVLYKLFTI